MRNSSYLDKKAFEAVVGDLDEQLEAARIDFPTDGWDAVPRTMESLDTPINSLPLGHIALQGDFSEQKSD
jgi:hypothetical protein